MSILHRYILREAIVPFLLGLGVFTLILFVARILKLAELVVSRGVPLEEVLRLFAFILPAFLEVTIPMAVLLGVLIAFGRLSSDSELIALTASGVSLRRLMLPVLMFALAAWVLALLVSLHGRPWGNKRLRETLYEVAKTRATAGIREKVFSDEFEGLVIYVDQVSGKGTTLNGVLISDTRDTRQQNTILARLGYVITNEEIQAVTLRLLDGSLHSLYDHDGSYHRTDFTTYDLNLDLGAALGRLRPREPAPSELTISELRASIARKASEGDPARPEQVELHRKFAIPFASVLFAFIGVPLGIRPTRAVRSRGFATSLSVIFVYYLLLTLGESLGARGVLPAALALWLPNLAFSPLALVLFLRAAEGAPMVAGSSPWVDRLQSRIRTTLWQT